MKRVLFVCLGNICRSPTAEGVFRKLVNDANLSHLVTIDSAGISNWNIGLSPDSRAISTALDRGIDISAIRARQVCANDLAENDYILAMDKQNLQSLSALASQSFGSGKNIGLFMSFADQFDEIDIPDPYNNDEQGFDMVLDMIEDASEGLLKRILSEEHG